MTTMRLNELIAQLRDIQRWLGSGNPFAIIGKAIPDDRNPGKIIAQGIEVEKVSLQFDNGGPVVLIELEDTEKQDEDFADYITEIRPSSTELPRPAARDLPPKDHPEKEMKMQSNVSIPGEDADPIEKGYQYGIKTPDGNVTWQRQVGKDDVYIEGVGFVMTASLPQAGSSQKTMDMADKTWRDSLRKAGVPLTEDMHLVRVRRLVTLLIEEPEEF